MMPFRELIDFERAKKIIMEKTWETERVEEVSITQACGRVLAESVKAELDIPGFARASMDGYAVIASDTFGASMKKPIKLRLIGKVFAGDAARKEVKRGTCLQIATGAPLPEGSDAVVMVENAMAEGNEVKIFKPVYPGANVSPENEDVSKGDEVLKKGDVLNPPKIGVLAALGRKKVRVYEKPEVHIYPTGKEVMPLGEKIEYGKIYDINSYTLAALLEKEGATVNIHPVVDDDKMAIEKCLEERQGDYIIFSGGSSVGERDMMADVIKSQGELFFHGIALKPGKPTIFGRVENTLIFGMPGYPTSCLTNAYVLLLPSIKKMARLPLNIKRGVAILAERIVSTIGRHQIYPVKVKEGRAYPVFKESGAITSLSEASGYIEIPANVEYLERDSKVLVNYF